MRHSVIGANKVKKHKLKTNNLCFLSASLLSWDRFFSKQHSNLIKFYRGPSDLNSSKNYQSYQLHNKFILNSRCVLKVLVWNLYKNISLRAHTLTRVHKVHSNAFICIPESAYIWMNLMHSRKRTSIDPVYSNTPLTMAILWIIVKSKC